ncbi:MAG: A24 family peptidase C-terminal domain-containing protein [Thermoplasmata archaeon]
MGEALLITQVVLLLGGFGFAAISDLRTREVTDHLWQALGLLGVALGAVDLAPNGLLPLGMWLVVGALVLQHLFAWDDALGPNYERFADLIEGVAYVAVVLLVVAGAVVAGVGPSGVSLPVVALLVTVLFARGLFELGVLYGGADAKALMIAGTLVPLLAVPLLAQTASTTLLLRVLPFPVTLLVNAALFSVAIPIGLALRNAARGEFSFPRGFAGYQIPVRELPEHFVWLKDPLAAGARSRDTARTSEDDRLERVRLARELEEQGVERVWVTPQIPFLVLMALGALAALLAGNLLLDLFARL